MPSRRTSSFERYVTSLIAKGEVPGLTMLLDQKGEILFERRYGWGALLPRREELAPDTLYDLASLTKPLVTAFLAVYLAARGLIRLEDEVRRYAPESGFSFTLCQLLTHTSGLPGWHPFYLYHDPGPLGLAAFSGLAPRCRPGKRVIYSCVGYMLLCRILEMAAGASLEGLAGEVLFRPLHLNNSFLTVPQGRRLQAAPTEKGNAREKSMCERFDRKAASRYAWRSGIIRGETHDVNSHHQGGFAGNAGLFADGRDLRRLALEFFPETATVLNGCWLELFWTNFTPGYGSHRSIGFKLNSSWLTSGGPALERAAIGHNGFTGTSFWLEPASRRIWILLTNRIHPRVKTGSFDPIRRKLHRLLEAHLDLP